MRIRQIVKIFFFATSGLLTAFGIFLLIFSWLSFNELKQWGEVRSLDIEVDLSQPGEFSYPFILECPYADSYDLLLILPPFPSSESKPDDLLAGLDAVYSIIDSNGLELPHLRKLRLEPLTKASGKPILFESIGRLPKAMYTFRLTVSQGAGALSGVEQHLIMTYNIGFAAALPLLALALGIPSFAFGVILTFSIVTLTRKKSDTHKGSQPTTAPDGTE